MYVVSFLLEEKNASSRKIPIVHIDTIRDTTVGRFAGNNKWKKIYLDFILSMAKGPEDEKLGALCRVVFPYATGNNSQKETRTRTYIYKHEDAKKYCCPAYSLKPLWISNACKILAGRTFSIFKKKKRKKNVNGSRGSSAYEFVCQLTRSAHACMHASRPASTTKRNETIGFSWSRPLFFTDIIYITILYLFLKNGHIGMRQEQLLIPRQNNKRRGQHTKEESALNLNACGNLQTNSKNKIMYASERGRKITTESINLVLVVCCLLLFEYVNKK